MIWNYLLASTNPWIFWLSHSTTQLPDQLRAAGAIVTLKVSRANISQGLFCIDDSMDWSSLHLFFKCLLLSSTVTSNFRNSPRCYHDDSSKCREGYCGVTRSMKVSCTKKLYEELCEMLMCSWTIWNPRTL